MPAYLLQALFAEPEVLAAALGAEPDGHRLIVAAPSGMRQTTPLHVAAIAGNTRLIRPLIAHGYPTHVKDRWGRTPLDTACTLHRLHTRSCNALRPRIN